MNKSHDCRYWVKSFRFEGDDYVFTLECDICQYVDEHKVRADEYDRIERLIDEMNK